MENKEVMNETTAVFSCFVFGILLVIRKFVMEEWLAVSWRLTSHALYYKIP